MIKLFLLLFLPFTIYASKILSYNIYDRTDRVDVMITFDTPYNGTIKQSTSNSKISIKLNGATIESSKLKQVSSKFLRSISITPVSGYTQIVATVPPSIELKASKTSDAYGLRLRFKNKTVKEAIPKEVKQSPLALLPTKHSDDMTRSYIIVVSILIIGIFILFYIKKRVTPINKKNPPKPDSWLFKDSQTSKEIDLNSSDVTIRFQKKINEHNSVAMLDFDEFSYLVLLGNNNILLDRFVDDKPVTQNDFDTILKNRHQELDEFLQVQKEPKEPLQAYKEKAASISYEV